MSKDVSYWNKTHCDRCHKEVKQGEGIYADGGFYHHDTCYIEHLKEIIAAYEWDELKTFNEPNIICPYCGYEDNDSWEYTDDSGDIECGRCGSEFNYSRNVEVTYTTVPKETDNGR